MATFVLVHGAWHGGWCYARVARLLRDAGHDVFTPTLTGVGERAHLAAPSITLDTHIRDVVNVIAYEGLDDVVLAGHSYGGMVISGVASAIGERLRSLVYLDATVPRDGESLLDLIGPTFALQFFAMARDNGGYLPPIPAAAFAVNARDAAWVDATCTPQPFATFVQGVRVNDAERAVPQRTYVIATGYETAYFDTVRDRVRADPRFTVRAIACGHDMMLDMPAETARLLLDELAVAARPQADQGVAG